MQGTQYENPGRSSFQCELHRLRITDLTDQKDIRHLPQSVFQGMGEGKEVPSIFPLADEGAGRTMQEFNRILQGQKMDGTLCHQRMQKGCKGGALSGACAAGDQQKALSDLQEPEQGGRRAEFCEGRNAVGNQTEGDGRLTALEVDISPEAALFCFPGKV